MAIRTSFWQKGAYPWFYPEKNLEIFTQGQMGCPKENFLLQRG